MGHHLAAEASIVNNRHLSSAGVALFVAALLVACHGIGSYTPTVSQEAPAQSQLSESPLTSAECKAPQRKIPGKYLSYFAEGNVKGTTFTALTSKDAAIWLVSD